MDSNNQRRTGFRITDGLMAPHLQEQEAYEQEQAGLPDLPASFGNPLLFAMARDPRTLFVYWNVDWRATFGPDEPRDRQVFLRVLDANGREESESLIEPLLGSFYAPITKPGAEYRVELGYYPRSGGWRTVAVSEAVTMPPDRVSENTVVDVATVPFHLSFQKMIDLFCESKGDPLTLVLSGIQNRATQDDADNTAQHHEEHEILWAIDLTVGEVRAGRRPFMKSSDEEQGLRKRAEAILGFGSTSPNRGFGGSSLS